MAGIVTRTGVDPITKYELVLGLAESAKQTALATDLLSGREVRSVEGDIELSVEVTRVGVRCNVIIRDPAVDSRLVISLRPLPGDEAGQPGRDVRNPHPMPDQWNPHDDERWEFFNCLVLAVYYE